MEGLIGIAFKDFVLLAADKTNAYSIIVVKSDEDKFYKLSDHLVMAICGEPGDTGQFAEFIEKNIQLYKMRNGFELSPKAAANFVQRNLAEYLRSRTPYQVNLLLGGFDTQANTADLFWMDYLASSTKLDYGMHGYGGFFTLGIMDRFYRADMSVEEGTALLKKAITEIQKRLIVNLPAFKVIMIDKDGVHDKEDIIVDAKNLGLENLSDLPKMVGETTSARAHHLIS